MNFVSLKNEIDVLLKKRAAVYPVRDANYIKLNNKIDQLSAYLMQTAKREVIKYEAPKMRPVFICGYMKSGTTLVSQLLDGHTRLFVMPGDSHYVNKRKEFAQLSVKQLYLHWMKRIVNPSGKEPFWFLGKDERHYQNFFRYLKTLSNKESFVRVVFALYLANKRKSGREIYWVEKTPNNEMHVDFLLRKFPNAKFVHIVRNPLHNVSSLNKLNSIRGWGLTVEGMAKDLRTKLVAARKNKTKVRKQYCVIRYEDLAEDGEKVMRHVAEFLEVSYEDTLLVPTENKKQGIANSMHKERMVRGRINKSLGKILLSRSDQNLVQEILRDEMKKFNY